MISEKIVFVIGATAVGKSKLGLEIAKRYNGEIVSADSMQIYQTASLMTAKPTAQERLEIPHHLVDFVPLAHTDFTICDYQPQALSIIQDIHRRGKLPVVVGGTMYYIESLLFDRNFSKNESRHIEGLSNEEMFSRIQEQDPEYATVVDRHNERRLRNALDYIVTTGCLYSQKDKLSSLRFSNYSLIWLECPQEVLRKRIRERIEIMLNDGGLEEIRQVLESGDNYTLGVLQSIGYKEFTAYMQHGQEAIPQCIDNLVNATVKYSKKQIRWIKNRMLDNLNVLRFDITSADFEHIKAKAFEDVEINRNNPLSFEISRVRNKHCEVCNVVVREDVFEKHLKSRKHIKKTEKMIEDDEVERVCEVCNKCMLGRKQWESHIRSKKHRKNKLRSEEV